MAAYGCPLRQLIKLPATFTIAAVRGWPVKPRRGLFHWPIFSGPPRQRHAPSQGAAPRANLWHTYCGQGSLQAASGGEGV